MKYNPPSNDRCLRSCGGRDHEIYLSGITTHYLGDRTPALRDPGFLLKKRSQAVRQVGIKLRSMSGIEWRSGQGTGVRIYAMISCLDIPSIESVRNEGMSQHSPALSSGILEFVYESRFR